MRIKYEDESLILKININFFFFEKELVNNGMVNRFHHPVLIEGLLDV